MSTVIRTVVSTRTIIIGNNSRTIVRPVTATRTIRTTGPQGPAGNNGTTANFTAEALSGTKNGVNRIFTISQTPSFEIDLKWNGLSQLLGRDYTRSGATITMATDSIPISTDDLTATYNF